MNTVQTLKAAGVSVEELPASIVQPAGRESEALLRELGTRSPIAGETYRSFVAFREKADAYAPAGDEAALRLRRLALAK
jgi:TRAP-type mannitol/chloroaromatic compound transport system substrate-binding protein